MKEQEIERVRKLERAGVRYCLSGLINSFELGYLKTLLKIWEWVIEKLFGNLQIFLGADALNSYAALLQGNQGLLWVARLARPL